MAILGFWIEKELLIKLTIAGVALVINCIVAMACKAREVMSWRRHNGAFADGDPQFLEELNGLSLFVILAVVISLVV